MNRITHSFRAYLRYMQISRFQVFAFVEGKITDPFFYGRICESVCLPLNNSYKINRSTDFLDGSGGKEVLKIFFLYLQRKNALISNFKGKKTGAIFFLDKDIDDLLNKKRKSEHVVYSRYYDIENQIFIEGDLINGISGATSMDRQEVLRIFNDYDTLLISTALLWKCWVKLCVFTAKKKIHCVCNYRVPSKINNPLTGNIDQTLFSNHIQTIQQNLGYSNQKFRNSFRRIENIIDSLYLNGNQDLVFKGKWYAILLALIIKDRVANIPIDSSDLEGKLKSCMMMSLNFNGPWAYYYKEPVEKLIRKL